MFHITVYQLSVKIETDSRNVIDFIEQFINLFYTVKSQQNSTNQVVADKKFYSRVQTRPEFYLHINQFLHLLHHAKEVCFAFPAPTREDKSQYACIKESYKVRDGLALRPHQVPIAEFLINNPTKSKMVSLYTGGGKTLTALYSLAQIGHKLAVVVLPIYYQKWMDDIVKVHDAKMKDIMYIAGGDSLRSIINMAREDEIRCRYYVFSITTLQGYIKDYETDPDKCIEKYGAAPIELFPLLGIGSMLIDETHQSFNAVYRILLHTNVQFQVGLSATLLTEDPVIARAHKIVYPPNWVHDESGLRKYTDVYALAYSIPSNFMPRVKTTNYGNKSYSHSAFEKSMTKSQDMATFYIRLIEGTVLDFYIDRCEKGDKCLIFVSTVSFATRLTKYLNERYPEFVSKRYCEEDPLTNLYEADISVSTIISAGTAVDIPDLRVVVQTVSVSSIVANVQSLGRLRELPGKDTRFCYLYAENIVKQKTYHYKRRELFYDRTATQKNMRARLA